MSKINAGAQPTNKVDNSQKAKDVKHGELYGKLAQHYTLHYLSRRLQDIPNPRKTFKTNPTLFENKIKRYKNKYCGDHHSHSFDDLRQAAQLMVHECAINFVKDKKELFWKWYLLSDEETNKIISAILFGEAKVACCNA